MWRSKQSEFIVWKLLGPDSSTQVIFLWRDGIMWPWVNYMFLLIHVKEWAIIFNIIKWLGNTGDSFLYPPTLEWQCLDTCCGGFSILFRRARRNPVYPFPIDRKCITLTLNKWGWDDIPWTAQFLSGVIKEECDSTVTLLKCRVVSRWLKLVSFFNNHVPLLNMKQWWWNWWIIHEFGILLIPFSKLTYLINKILDKPLLAYSLVLSIQK